MHLHDDCTLIDACLLIRFIYSADPAGVNVREAKAKRKDANQRRAAKRAAKRAAFLETLPYGGDAQLAQRSGDRDAIRQIFQARKQLVCLICGAYALSLSLSLSLSHTHTHTHSLPLTHTLSLRVCVCCVRECVICVRCFDFSCLRARVYRVNVRFLCFVCALCAVRSCFMLFKCMRCVVYFVR
jgi:hypothetical protein